MITDPSVDPVGVRRRLGLVFQAYNLFPHLTVLQNVVLGSHRGHGVPRAEAEDGGAGAARAARARRARGRPPRRASRAASSSGSRSRARSWRGRGRCCSTRSPRALDPELVGEVLETVRALKDEGVTMLIATHEMGFAREVADRVCFLHEGRLVEVGPPEQVLGDPQQPETQRFLRRLLEAGRA